MRQCGLIRNSSMFILIHAVVFTLIKVPDNASHEPKQVAQCHMAVKCCV